MSTGIDFTEIVHEGVRRFAGLEPNSPINGSQQLKDDLGIDSLARIDLVVAIERRAGIMMPEELLVTVITVDDLLAVARDTAAAGAGT